MYDKYHVYIYVCLFRIYSNQSKNKLQLKRKYNNSLQSYLFQGSAQFVWNMTKSIISLLMKIIEERNKLYQTAYGDINNGDDNYSPLSKLELECFSSSLDDKIFEKIINSREETLWLFFNQRNHMPLVDECLELNNHRGRRRLMRCFPSHPNEGLSILIQNTTIKASLIPRAGFIPIWTRETNVIWTMPTENLLFEDGMFRQENLFSDVDVILHQVLQRNLRTEELITALHTRRVWSAYLHKTSENQDIFRAHHLDAQNAQLELGQRFDPYILGFDDALPLPIVQNDQAEEDDLVLFEEVITIDDEVNTQDVEGRDQDEQEMEVQGGDQNGCKMEIQETANIVDDEQDDAMRWSPKYVDTEDDENQQQHCDETSEQKTYQEQARQCSTYQEQVRRYPAYNQHIYINTQGHHYSIAPVQNDICNVANYYSYNTHNNNVHTEEFENQQENSEVTNEQAQLTETDSIEIIDVTTVPADETSGEQHPIDDEMMNVSNENLKQKDTENENIEIQDETEQICDETNEDEEKGGDVQTGKKNSNFIKIKECAVILKNLKIKPTFETVESIDEVAEQYDEATEPCETPVDDMTTTDETANEADVDDVSTNGVIVDGDMNEDTTSRASTPEVERIRLWIKESAEAEAKRKREEKKKQRKLKMRVQTNNAIRCLKKEMRDREGVLMNKAKADFDGTTIRYNISKENQGTIKTLDKIQQVLDEIKDTIAESHENISFKKMRNIRLEIEKLYFKMGSTRTQRAFSIVNMILQTIKPDVEVQHDDEAAEVDEVQHDDETAEVDEVD